VNSGWRRAAVFGLRTSNVDTNLVYMPVMHTLPLNRGYELNFIRLPVDAVRIDCVCLAMPAAQYIIEVPQFLLSKRHALLNQATGSTRARKQGARRSGLPVPRVNLEPEQHLRSPAAAGPEEHRGGVPLGRVSGHVRKKSYRHSFPVSDTQPCALRVLGKCHQYSTAV
jgi:hypothetical protein